MSQSNAAKLKPSQVKKALKAELAAAWAVSRAKHPNHTPYAFVLYGVEGAPYPHLGPHVLTEESLIQVAKRYVDSGHYEELDEARKALRYSIADSPHFGDVEDHVHSVDNLIEPHAESMEEADGWALLAKAAMQALSELDAEELFGTGSDRERLLLFVEVLESDKDWVTPSAKKLNSATTFKRFQDETKTEGEFASCDHLAVAVDGKSIYAAMTFKNPNGKPGANEFNKELIAFDVSPGRLDRRWTYPVLVSSARDIANYSDGGLAVLLVNYPPGFGAETILMRFGQSSNQPSEQRLQGEGGFFAVSPDGQRFAVAMHDKTVHILDGDRRPLRCRKFDAKPYFMCFLQSDQLLIATESEVLHVEPESLKTTTFISCPAFDLSLSDDQELLAVSRWFALSGPERDHPVEFGVNLYRLPSRELVRPFLIPGHQAVRAKLSPNGRLLAFEARQIGSARKFLVVCDTITGQEVARRRTEITHDFQFLRDNRTLAIGICEYTKSIPIHFWELPNLES